MLALHGRDLGGKQRPLDAARSPGVRPGFFFVLFALLVDDLCFRFGTPSYSVLCYSFKMTMRFELVHSMLPRR